MRVASDHVVALDYRLQLDDGTLVEESEPGEPLTYLHGHGQLVPGLERALEGMSTGESKRVTVAPADGYGDRDEERVQSVPLSAFPDDVEVEPGAIMQAETMDGHELSFLVLEVQEEQAIVDFNHPLAGQTLHFDVTIRGVRAATADEIAHADHDCDHDHG